MASQITKNGKKVWRARVIKSGETRSRIFQTKKEATAWEVQERKADWSKTDTDYLLIEFAQDYLDYSKSLHDLKTFDEKRRAFKKLFEAKGAQDCPIVNPSIPVAELKKDSVLAALLVQYETRSGDAANKDRKNLVAAWNWGIKTKGLPESNPFQVDKFPEIRHPRYIPPEEDFWKVYDLTTGQDKVMLTTFLFTAASEGKYSVKMGGYRFFSKFDPACSPKREKVVLLSQIIYRMAIYIEGVTFNGGGTTAHSKTTSEHIFLNPLILIGVPKGIRTPVTGVKGRCPGPG
jgi:hypothetical protein